MDLYMLEFPTINNRKDKMIYLIMKHTPYEYINDSYDIVSSTDNLDEANNKVQGYRMINENKNISFSILKYEPPLILTEEVA